MQSVRSFSFAFLPLSMLLAACSSAPQQPEAPKSKGVEGAWLLTVDSPMGTRENEAVFVQNGQQLTGVIKGQRGETPLNPRLVVAREQPREAAE